MTVPALILIPVNTAVAVVFIVIGDPAHRGAAPPIKFPDTAKSLPDVFEIEIQRKVALAAKVLRVLV